MPQTYRRRSGYLSERERHLGIRTIDKAVPDLELLGRIIVDLAMAALAPVRPPVKDAAGLRVTSRNPAKQS
ncbi:MAG: hypothetical protein FWC46_01000 [Actinomycetia bacterium]|nr:hypothetical protein [Actinomycetes bacterium]